MPSKLFYDNKLVPRADAARTHALLAWSEAWLAKERVQRDGAAPSPLIFDSIIGADERENTSPSFFNLTEVWRVGQYVRSLVAHGVSAADIGVISPYRQQCNKIKRYLQKKLSLQKIRVGSVEEFQGQEKLVILISTARSSSAFVSSDLKHAIG